MGTKTEILFLQAKKINGYIFGVYSRRNSALQGRTLERICIGLVRISCFEGRL
jgi:hypothetical protein